MNPDLYNSAKILAVDKLPIDINLGQYVKITFTYSQIISSLYLQTTGKIVKF